MDLELLIYFQLFGITFLGTGVVLKFLPRFVPIDELVDTIASTTSQTGNDSQGQTWELLRFMKCLLDFFLRVSKYSNVSRNGIAMKG